MDSDDPGGMTPPRGTPSVPKRRVWVSDPGLTIGMATTVLGLLLLLATPASAADLPLPSLPVAVPSLPVPTVPLPTLPVATPKLPTPTLRPLPTLPAPTPTLPLPTLTLPPPPTLPVPTPSLPVPTPTLPVVTPTLPLPTPTPRPTATAQPSPSTTPSPSPAPSLVGGGPVGSPTTLGAPVVGQPVLASGVPAGPGTPTIVDRGSPFDSFVVPGLIVGVPAIIILGILLAQLAVGAAWMPVIKRWLNRRV